MKLIISLIIIILFQFTNILIADERCTIERKQWIKFYKQDFARNFTKIEYGSDPCLVSIISQEYKGDVESLLIGTKENSTQNILSNLSDNRDINWVPEYFEMMLTKIMYMELTTFIKMSMRMQQYF